jgi:hypothetical protein
MLTHQLDGFPAVTGLGHHRDARLGVEDHLQAAADHPLIVGDQDRDGPPGAALDVAAAAALSVYAAGLTSGVLHTSHPHGGVGASIGVLAMTLPGRLAPPGTAGGGRRDGRLRRTQRSDFRPHGPVRCHAARPLPGGVRSRRTVR